MVLNAGRKNVDLVEAIAKIPDGAIVALGGNTLHRTPSAAVHEMIRQQKRDLTVVKTAGGYDVDILCGAGCISRLMIAYVGFENIQGMALHFRRKVESGEIVLDEHTCPTVIAGMRASAQGVPFMPIAGMTGTDLVHGRFHAVSNPYGPGQIVTVPAIEPDWAIVHVQEADPLGNARIHGTEFEDVLMTRAAKNVLVTCETLVDGTSFQDEPELTSISGFQVNLVVEAPRGAWPASCAGYYDVDEQFLADYYTAGASEDDFQHFVNRVFAPAALSPDKHSLAAPGIR